ncbi:hypothetical protein NMY22_g13801 [Coprinellus aureogranulatus]|nr:hypothetical protein NMY22_g13801 [Coprinellus aureogranulatus]
MDSIPRARKTSTTSNKSAISTGMLSRIRVAVSTTSVNTTPLEVEPSMEDLIETSKQNREVGRAKAEEFKISASAQALPLPARYSTASVSDHESPPAYDHHHFDNRLSVTSSDTSNSTSPPHLPLPLASEGRFEPQTTVSKKTGIIRTQLKPLPPSEALGIPTRPGVAFSGSKARPATEPFDLRDKDSKQELPGPDSYSHSGMAKSAPAFPPPPGGQQIDTSHLYVVPPGLSASKRYREAGEQRRRIMKALPPTPSGSRPPSAGPTSSCS